MEALKCLITGRQSGRLFSMRDTLIYWFKMLVVIYGARLAFKFIWAAYSNYLKQKNLEHVRKQHNTRLDMAISEVKEMIRNNSSLVPSEDVVSRILISDARDLKNMLDKKEISSVQLVLVFLQKCITTGVKLNAITDFCHKDALERAKACDENRFTLEKVPVLYGIPVSLMNNIEVKGTSCTMGMSRGFEEFSSEDGYLAHVIKVELGAIPIVKSNTSTGLLLLDGNNSIGGGVSNSHDSTRVAGAASGGEAALISSNCTPIGFATDLIGNVNMGSMYSGIYGFSISADRCTTKGVALPPYCAREYLRVTVGVLSKSIKDIQDIVFQLVTSDTMIDQDFYLNSSPWNDAQLSSLLNFKLAILPSHPKYPLTKSQKRILGSTIKILKEKGHQIIPLDFKHTYEIVELFIKLNGQMIYAESDYMKLDSVNGEIKLLKEIHRRKSMVNTVTELFFGGKPECMRETYYNNIVRSTNIEGFLKCYEFIQFYTHQLYKLLRDEGIDAILIPGLSVAPKKDLVQDIHKTIMPHLFAQAARLPSGSVPIDGLKPDEVTYSDEYIDKYTTKLNENLNGASGLPVGIQVCSSRNSDERCLQVMKIISDNRYLIANN